MVIPWWKPVNCPRRVRSRARRPQTVVLYRTLTPQGLSARYGYTIHHRLFRLILMTRGLKIKQPKMLKTVGKTGISILTCPLHHHILLLSTHLSPAPPYFRLTCPPHHHIFDSPVPYTTIFSTHLSPTPPYFRLTCPLHHHIFDSKNRPVPYTTIFVR
jgi:hypothetical protein